MMRCSNQCRGTFIMCGVFLAVGIVLQLVGGPDSDVGALSGFYFPTCAALLVKLPMSGMVADLPRMSYRRKAIQTRVTEVFYLISNLIFATIFLAVIMLYTVIYPDKLVGGMADSTIVAQAMLCAVTYVVVGIQMHLGDKLKSALVFALVVEASVMGVSVFVDSEILVRPMPIWALFVIVYGAVLVTTLVCIPISYRIYSVDDNYSEARLAAMQAQ